MRRSRCFAVHRRGGIIPGPVRGALGYTPAVPAERIAENLAFINWTVLTGLAVGSFGAVVLARLRTDATRGFLVFTAGCAVVLAVLAYLSDQALPATLGGSPIVTDGTFDTPRRVALGTFVVLAAAYTIALTQRRRAPALAAGALSAAAAVLVCGALAWGGGTFGAVPLLVQLVVLAVATGGVFAAMILGHWYLVTPKLPEAPLILIARSLLAVVGLQLLLFGVWVATGAGPAGASRAVRVAGRASGRCSSGCGSSSGSCSRSSCRGRRSRPHGRARWSRRRGCCTSTSARSPPARSWQRVSTSAPGYFGAWGRV